MEDEYKKGSLSLTRSISLDTGVTIGAGSFDTHAKIPKPSIDLNR